MSENNKEEQALVSGKASKEGGGEWSLPDGNPFMKGVEKVVSPFRGKAVTEAPAGYEQIALKGLNIGKVPVKNTPVPARSKPSVDKEEKALLKKELEGEGKKPINRKNRWFERNAPKREEEGFEEVLDEVPVGFVPEQKPKKRRQNWFEPNAPRSSVDEEVEFEEEPEVGFVPEVEVENLVESLEEDYKEEAELVDEGSVVEEREVGFVPEQIIEEDPPIEKEEVLIEEAEPEVFDEHSEEFLAGFIPEQEQELIEKQVKQLEEPESELVYDPVSEAKEVEVTAEEVFAQENEEQKALVEAPPSPFAEVMQEKSIQEAFIREDVEEGIFPKAQEEETFSPFEQEAESSVFPQTGGQLQGGVPPFTQKTPPSDSDGSPFKPYQGPSIPFPSVNNTAPPPVSAPVFEPLPRQSPSPFQLYSPPIVNQPPPISPAPAPTNISPFQRHKMEGGEVFGGGKFKKVIAEPIPQEGGFVEGASQIPPSFSSQSIPQGEGFVGGGRERQKYLKKIFGVSHDMTRDELLQRARNLPGIKHLEAVERSEAEAFRTMSEVMSRFGYYNERAWDASNSKEAVEFIRAGETALTVLREGRYEEGVHETLLMIARELDQMK